MFGGGIERLKYHLRHLGFVGFGERRQPEESAGAERKRSE
jgi:hypothetical protein